MRDITKKATIANGASQSDVIDLESFPIVGIVMPSSWTAANLTFLGCATSDGTFVPLHDDGGTEVSITAAASRFITPTGAKADALACVRYLKIRSGTTATPVNQGAERIIYLQLKRLG